MSALDQRQEDWLAGWAAREQEVLDAYWHGVRDTQRAQSERWASYCQHLSAVAATPPQDVLAERRGDQQRAEAIRRYWQLTGLRSSQLPTRPVDPRLRAAFIARCLASWGLPAAEVAA